MGDSREPTATVGSVAKYRIVSWDADFYVVTADGSYVARTPQRAIAEVLLRALNEQETAEAQERSH